jgi:type IV secretory pathway TrbD component
MRYALGTVLSLPLSLMLIGLLAAALPMPWQEWLVLQLIAAVLLWMLLVLLVALPAKAQPILVALGVANLAAWLALQATPLYGVGA